MHRSHACPHRAAARDTQRKITVHFQRNKSYGPATKYTRPAASLEARGRQFAADAARHSKSKRLGQVTLRDLGWEPPTAPATGPDLELDVVEAMPVADGSQLQAFNDRMRAF